jgi:ZIP family zinc transporter
MDYSNLLLLSSIAGFTIFLGLPAAMIATQPRARALMTSLSAGVLIFLLIEIAYKCLEMVEESAKSALSGSASATPVLFGALLIGGISIGLLGLTFFEEHFMGMAKESDPATRSKRVSLMIALGIGLHNFGEGLAIGQEYANGALSLAYLLVAGFALHNATEGFGIAAPLQTAKVDWKFLGIAGFVGGGPTVIGTLVGSAYTLPALELLALSLAAGSILYVVGELLHIGKMQGQHRTAMVGLLIGFFAAFGSEMVIEIGMAASANRMKPTETFQVEATEFHFSPSNFTVNAGGTIRFEIRNTGKETHEFELPELKLEAVIPPGDKATLTIPKAAPGLYKIECDLPGHVAKGMTGELLVRK